MNLSRFMINMKKLAALVLLTFILFSCGSSDKKIREEAHRIHQLALTVDSHTDTPLWFNRDGFDFGKDNRGLNRSKIDIPRMEEGGMDAIFLAAFLGQGPRTEEGNQRAKASCDEIIEAIFKVAEKNQEKAAIATSPEDAYHLEKQGKKAFFIGMENGYPLGTDISLVEEYYNKGVRYITLCHTRNNDICDSSTDTIEHNGLTTFGEYVVKEMNRLGMMIDVSHISDQSFLDVIELSDDPVIASHSCAKAVCNNPRNLSDSLLLKLKENGGVIQMCILSDYVKTPPPQPERDSIRNDISRRFSQLTEDSPKEELAKLRHEWYALDETHPPILATVSDAVDHIDHIVNLIGIDHVGIGTDFDGGGGLSDCKDVSEMENITYELVKRGYSEDDIVKIWGGNLMRVFRQIQKSN